MSYCARPRLIVFAKAPYMGGAKTRLAAGIGKVHANRLYRAMTRQIFRNLKDPRWDIIIAGTPDTDIEKSFGGVWPGTLARMSQGQGSLSPRLARAFGGRGITLIIGTDAPQIRARDIALAVKMLRRKRAVFGPADDGGFWLIGARGPVNPDVFARVNWSTSSALSDVAANINGPIGYLRTLIDVDNVKALAALRRAR